MKSGDEMELAQNRFMAGEGSDRSAAMNRQRAGLSEVIAALLILVISVAMGTIFFAWGTTVLGLTESGFIQQTTLSRDKVEERITVTSIFNATEPDSVFDLPLDSDNDLYIAVFNYGRRSAELATVYFGSDDLTPYDFDSAEFFVCDEERSSCSSSGDSNVVSVGELAWILIEEPNASNLEKGTTYTVVITTERGNSYELLFEA